MTAPARVAGPVPRAALTAFLGVATAVSMHLALGAPGSARSPAGPTQVADSCEGSSDATFLPSNRRLATTAAGRVIGLYDPHGSGQQLVWRDPGQPWRTDTRGATSNGFIRVGRHGDRPASIAVARDPSGRQHAWTVWAGHDFASHRLSIEMHRLSQLDRAAGPVVGPARVIAKAGRKGHARATIAFQGRGRRAKGVVAWLARTKDSFDLVTEWFTNLRRDRPRLHHRKVLFSSRRASPTPTLLPTRAGMWLVTTTPRSRLTVLTHRRGAPLRKWQRTRAGVGVERSSTPSAIAWRRGSILVAVERGGRRENVSIIRFDRRARRARAVLKVRDHLQPALARVGRRAYLVMIRARDSAVVSRRLTPGGRWSRRDRVEIGGGVYAWPNALGSARSYLRFIVQGETCPTNPNAHAVVAYTRRA
jgi:hypothetical protein